MTGPDWSHTSKMTGSCTNRPPTGHFTSLIYLQSTMMIDLHLLFVYFIVERTLNEFASSRSVFFGNEAHETSKICYQIIFKVFKKILS